MTVRSVLALPVFPGRFQPSIVGRSELNYRVRNGNGWTLALISTNCRRHKLRSVVSPLRIETGFATSWTGLRGNGIGQSLAFFLYVIRLTGEQATL